MSRSLALILAGGSGTRLWPVSRKAMPKQFLSLCGRHDTLLQLTAKRLLRLVDAQQMAVIASPKWGDTIAKQLGDVGIAGYRAITEPEGRNTAPAIALAVATLLRGGASPDDVVLVCPSDHLINDEDAFTSAARTAFDEARRGSIVTFGITPTYPETGFGYIKTEKRSGASGAALAVERFVEKPDRARAAEYVASGDHYWNGGYFCFRLADMVDAFGRHFPDGAAILTDDESASTRAFLACTKLSIDHAVMEHAQNISCVPLDAGWSDVGSWDAVCKNSPQDEAGNASSGATTLVNTSGCIIQETSQGKRILVADMHDIVIIDTPDALLVAPRSSSQRLSSIVRQIDDDGVR